MKSNVSQTESLNMKVPITKMLLLFFYENLTKVFTQLFQVFSNSALTFNVNAMEQP